MAAEERNGEVSTQGECTDCTQRERSFDALARGLANGTISRRRALRMLGGALLGGSVASIPGVGWLAGDSGEAQAQTAPGDSTCAGQGQSCTAQKCCAGYTCLVDGTSGTERFCCPALGSTVVCAQVCCPIGTEGCDADKKCACPADKSLVCTPLTMDHPGECCDPLTETCMPDGRCCKNELVCGSTCLEAVCDATQCLECKVDPVTNLGTCASKCNLLTETCCPGSPQGTCCETVGTNAPEFCGVTEDPNDGAALTCCAAALRCGSTCLAQACDATQCLECKVDPVTNLGTCASKCDPTKGQTCCPGTGTNAGVCCQTQAVGTQPATQFCGLTPDPDDGAALTCCAAALKCGNACLAAPCDAAQCLECKVDPVTGAGTCASKCDPTKGQTCCPGTGTNAGVCCQTEVVNGQAATQFCGFTASTTDDPTAVTCCAAALKCGNTCLTAACDASKCLECKVDQTTGVGTCGSKCGTNQCCQVGTSGQAGTCQSGTTSTACGPAGGICTQCTAVCQKCENRTCVADTSKNGETCAGTGQERQRCCQGVCCPARQMCRGTPLTCTA